MRLTKLKLAGFKSFVDPTSVSLPGQLVGVVGPNGCGKSNIMDAVRWVLGESKASELRGESMQDVIFNGSSNRKPVSRASVELIFENSLGRALGQWSQYTELAVKRMLTRNGQSDYFINNIKVRRKDITDLFLGTGLGPRAYAIIGQGMISRIIEARPEDLRVFLEEAAGVTRYKERRKETQGRLEDTKENLTRVEDIRLELGAQMERLEGQAEIARQYHAYNDQLTRRQQVLWLLRRNEAQAERNRLSQEVAQAVNDLESQSASLREVEARLEVAREAHFAAGDAVHSTQSAMFEANADVARLEAEIRHRRESRAQLQSRLAQLAVELAHWQEQADKLLRDRGRWEELQELAAGQVDEAQARLEMQQERLPEIEDLHENLENEADRHRQQQFQTEQKLQVEETHKAHALRSLHAVAQRRERLQGELETLEGPDPRELEEKQEELLLLREELAEQEATLATLQQELPALERVRQDLQAQLQQQGKTLAGAQARRAALEQMQQRLQAGGKLAEWLQAQGLDGSQPLWKHVTVEPGWEDAVESLLRERLQALAAHDLPPSRPGARLALVLPGTPGASAEAATADSLLALVGSGRPAVQAVLNEWLNGVRVCNGVEEGWRRRQELQPGEVFVTREGDRITPHSISYFAADEAGHGMLERQREIESLGLEIEAAETRIESAQVELSATETAVDEHQSQIQSARRTLAEAQGRVHDAQVETLKLSQAVDRSRERREQIETQLADLDAEAEGEKERQFAAEETIAELQETLAQLKDDAEGVMTRLEEAERALRDETTKLHAVERELREAQFSQKECQTKLQEIFSNLAQAERQLQRVKDDQEQCQVLAESNPEEVLEEQLQLALETRQEKEQALIEARNNLESATQALRELEERRMRIEQGQEPMRARISDLQLKEQAAAMNAEQYGGQLLESGADEAALMDDLPSAKPQSLAQEIGRLQKAITDLGAVNLAALEELETAKQRKGYLDAQAADLTEAMETLENAIRRIDKETRDLLQNTFDTVNGHFGTLFPELFGGGRAELVMTGEEILDAGVQVIAQPPGKKNSTIHLLSGGEKALTAIALVFSMFQLNPAPFCLLDEVDAPLDDSNTERFCSMVKKMSGQTQFLFISHNKIAMEMAQQLVGVTMQESGVSRVVEVDIQEALRMAEAV